MVQSRQARKAAHAKYLERLRADALAAQVALRDTIDLQGTASDLFFRLREQERVIAHLKAERVEHLRLLREMAKRLAHRIESSAR